MKIKQALKDGNERGARRQLFEELFNDFYRSRHKVYTMNLVRGIYFGFGTVLGGTVVVAIIIWLLSIFADWFPAMGDAIRNFVITLQR